MITDAQFSQLIHAIQGSPWDQLSQRGYWLSQIALLVFAVLAAIAAFRQVSATKLFEMLKFVEQEEFREARRIIYFEIRRQPPEAKWWEQKEHDRWEKAAAKVCASYDILGLVAKCNLAARLHRGIGWFFIREWCNSIVNAHEALRPYLAYRRKTRPNAYHGFTWLYDRARLCAETSP
jgi:hypothetical protein